MTTDAKTNLIGIASAVSASLFFTINDTAIKFLSGGYALHEVVLIRSVLSLALLLGIFMPLAGGYHHLRTRRLGAHVLRGLCVVFSNMTFFLGLAAMPIAEATAIFFVAPLVITGFSVIFLGETVGPRRWAAVGMGLLGVIVIMRPGTASFQPAALLPLAAAFGYAGLHTLTRRIGTSESAVTMTFYIQVTFLVVSALFGLTIGQGQFADGLSGPLDFLTRAWIVPDRGDLLLFAAIAVAGTLGGFLITQAYRLCEAGLAAPFEYAALPLSVVWGFFVFGEWPDSTTWAGISLILASGLYMAWRETAQERPLAGRRPKRR